MRIVVEISLIDALKNDLKKLFNEGLESEEIFMILSKLIFDIVFED